MVVRFLHFSFSVFLNRAFVWLTILLFAEIELRLKKKLYLNFNFNSNYFFLIAKTQLVSHSRILFICKLRLKLTKQITVSKCFLINENLYELYNFFT